MGAFLVSTETCSRFHGDPSGPTSAPFQTQSSSYSSFDRSSSSKTCLAATSPCAEHFTRHISISATNPRWRPSRTARATATCIDLQDYGSVNLDARRFPHIAFDTRSRAVLSDRLFRTVPLPSTISGRLTDSRPEMSFEGWPLRKSRAFRSESNARK